MAKVKHGHAVDARGQVQITTENLPKHLRNHSTGSEGTITDKLSRRLLDRVLKSG